ncbi:hypothetical protein V8F33_013749 [Rhypophila sp. PSN 637]
MTPAQPPAPAGWSRWPQHHPDGEYYMDPGIMPYDSRPITTAPLQRPLTKVDALMEAIQSKSGVKLAQEKTKAEPEHIVQIQDPKTDMMSQRPQPSVPLQQLHLPGTQREPLSSGTQSRSSKLKARIYACEFPDCGKSFSHKTHLDIHTRSHTGEEPYVCSFGCGKRFTQVGNQKTHERRHTGMKPHKCTICGEGFIKRGDLIAHSIRHSKTKPFLCKLDNCHKKFTKRGNLKSHQNKFHTATLEALIKKFAATKPSEVSNEDKELWEKNFTDLYENSNKGIKGRGKHHKVKLLTQISRVPDFHAPFFHGPPQILNTPQPFYPQLPPHFISNFALYHNAQDSNSQYGMFEIGNNSVAGSIPLSTAHEEHHGELAFGDRMY